MRGTVEAMRTLSLLRHAKSSRDAPVLDDFARPLAPRGLRDAPRIGAFIRERGLVPDLVLCSSAARTRETVALVVAAIGDKRVKVVYDEALYLASPGLLLATVRRLPDAVRHAMLVGHNPGMQALALDLVATGSRADIAALGVKFPTAGLAVIDLDVAAWSQVRAASGTLRLFTGPKRLAG